MVKVVESLEEELNEESNLLFRKVVNRLFKYWWLFLVCVLFSVILAFLYIRYSPRIYSVGAKVMIDEPTQEFDPKDFLFGDSRLKKSNEIVNKIITLKSYPVIQETVHELDQHVNYYRSTSALERIIQIESDDSPYKIIFPSGDSSSFSRSIGVGDPYEVKLNGKTVEIFDADGKSKTQGEIGKVLSLDGMSFIIDKNIRLKEPLEEVKYLFSIRSIASVTSMYQSRIGVNLVDEDASIINVTIAGELPGREARFINKLISNFQDRNLREKNQGASNTIRFISSELENIKDSLADIENRLKVFKRQNRISDLDSDADHLYEQVYSIEGQKAELQLKSKYLELTEAYLADHDAGKLLAPSSFGLNDNNLNAISTELLELENRLLQLGSSDQSIIRSQIKDRIQSLRGTMSEMIDNFQRTNELELSQVNRRLKNVESMLQSIPVSQIELVNIERLYSLSENLYVLLLEKKAEAEITRSSSVPDIKFVEEARLLSTTPIKPDKQLVYSFFILGGLGLPFVWLFYLVYRDRTLRTKDDVVNRTEVPFLGMIASVSGTVTNEYLLEKPKSRLAETLRTLRSNLKYVLPDKKSYVLLVTSCFPGEGKTFISSKLSISLASANKRMVVLGADLRKPQLHKQFEVSNSIGLSNYLAKDIDLQDVITKTDVGVDLILSGPIPPNPMELLDSDKFKNLLEELKTLYDYVLIDTSPFMLVADTKSILDLTDVNLIILRSGYSRKDNLKHIHELVSEHSEKKFGLVLNDHNMSDEFTYSYGKTGYYGRGKSYGYYEED